MEVAEAACAENETIHNEPIPVEPMTVLSALMAADAEGRSQGADAGCHASLPQGLRQRLDADGWQGEEPTSWAFEELLQEESPHAQVQVEGPFICGPGVTMSRAWAAIRPPSIFWTRTFPKTPSGTAV